MGKRASKHNPIRRGVAGSVILLILLIVIVSVSVSIGPWHVPASRQLAIIGHHTLGLPFPKTGNADDQATLILQDSVIWDMRIPRVLLAVIVGMLLAVAGAALQGLLLNPLADPYTVGVSSGAALGAAVAFVIPGLAVWFHGYGVPASAFIGACGAMLVVYAIARFSGRVSIHSFLLAGIVVSSFLWAALTFVLTMARRDLAEIVRWLLGSFADATWSHVWTTVPFAVLGLVVLYAMSKDLNVYSLGEETARHLGIETESLKLIIIALTSLITAAAVSVSGIIGFVGLMVPHIARRIFGSDHRVLLPTAALSGGILMVLADTASRLLGMLPKMPSELPVGVITALLGAPFFLYLLRKQSVK